MKWFTDWLARRRLRQAHEDALDYDKAFGLGWDLAQKLTLDDAPEDHFWMHVDHASECPAFHHGVASYATYMRPVIGRLSQGYTS